MYQTKRTMSTRLGNSTQAKKPYQSNVYIGRGLRKDKTGHDVETVFMVSSGNYWYINESESGGLYGGFQLSGAYNINQLAQHFLSVDKDAEKVNITLFFYDKDAEYIDKWRQDHDDMQKSFVCTLYEKQNREGKTKICGQIVRLM